MELVLLESAARSSLIALFVGIGLWALRIQRPAARHHAWTAVTVVMLLLPLWTIWGTKVAIPLPDPGFRAIENLPTAIFQTTAQPEASDPGRERIAPSSSVNWRSTIAWIYALGVGVMLVRLALGVMAARGLRRSAQPEIGFSTSAACVSPLTVGLLPPTIILPAQWRDWPPNQLDAVLAHEREHVRRRDPLIRFVALLNRAIFWFHPLAWWLERRLSALAEEACDAVVLENGRDPDEYANCLINIARDVTATGTSINTTGTAMARGLLARRLRRILRRSPDQPLSRRRAVLAAALCAITSLVFLAITLERSKTRGPEPAPLPASAESSESREEAANASPAHDAPRLIASAEPDALKTASGPLPLVRNPLQQPVETIEAPGSGELLPCNAYTLRFTPPQPSVDHALRIVPPTITGDEEMAIMPCLPEAAPETPVTLSRRTISGFGSAGRFPIGNLHSLIEPERSRSTSPKDPCRRQPPLRPFSCDFPAP